jgi:predicted component of type VI protein secretion system
MVQFDLDTEEQQFLIEALQSALGDLGMEIADTDRKDFRDALKKRQGTLRKVLETLTQTVEA